jgi:hypothetical protein
MDGYPMLMDSNITFRMLFCKRFVAKLPPSSRAQLLAVELVNFCVAFELKVP